MADPEGPTPRPGQGEDQGSPLWAAVDEALVGWLLPPDPVLAEAEAAARAAGLPEIQVSALQGRLLEVLARAIGARRVLEIGTLFGYSAICLARALPPEGRLVTLEVEPRHAELARANLARAQLADRVEVRVGRALDLLPALERELGARSVDLCFIDADKPSNAEYFGWALRLARPGGLVVVDNVVRHGRILEEGEATPDVAGTRALFDAVARAEGVVASVLQTVGAKGHDGLLVAVLPPA